MTTVKSQLDKLKQDYIASGKTDIASTKAYQDAFRKLASSQITAPVITTAPKITAPTTTTSKTTAPKATAPTTTKMWTGSGYSIVNDKYVSDKEKLGWTTTLPSQEEISNLIKNPITTSQKYDVNTKSVIDKPILPVPIKPVETAPTAPISTTQDDIRERLKEEQINNQRAIFDSLLAQTTGRLEQEEASIAPRVREEIGQIRTQDTMAKAESEKFRASGGISTSGARGQDILTQNILTSGRTGESMARESDQRADIERRLSEAQLARDSGVATAQSDAEIASLTEQLNQLAVTEDRAYQQQQLESDRAYQEGISQAQSLSEAEVREYERKIELENYAIEEEILEARNIGDQEKAIELENIKSANDRYLEGIRSANTQTEISLREQEERATISYKDQFTLEGEEGPTYSDKVVYDSVERQIENSIGKELESIGTTVDRWNNIIKPELSASKEETIVSETVSKWIVDNGSTLTNSQIDNLMLEYGLSQDYVRQFIKTDNIQGTSNWK